MCDEGRWRHRHVSLAAVPRVAVYLMEAAVSGERMVETWIAAMETAMETAVLCTSVNHGIAPKRRSNKRKAELRLIHIV